jgi:ribosomal protein S12 methylthiotransferase
MPGKKHGNVTVGFVALGCPKNVVDSEKMLAHIAEAGFLITADPGRADVVVINTCGFIEPARLESLDAIAEALANKRQGRVKKVIVAGCLSQRLGRELLGQASEVDAVVGLEHRDAIARIIRAALVSEAARVYHGPSGPTTLDDRVRLRIGPAHSAYLRISEGCSHRCSFCTIPAIRGPFRSKPEAMVLAEAQELAESGAVELNVIGQDTTRYGRDLQRRDGLAALLDALEQVPGVAWLRLLYAYPTGITDRLLETIARRGKVVPYLDIPMQHAHDRILAAMRRPDRQEGLRRLLERLRTAVPDIVLRTTLIVGFPGETPDEFRTVLDFVRWARFDALGAFPYFREAGTPAAELPDQVPEEVKQARLEELMLTQQEIAFDRNKERIGSRLVCLVEDAGGHRPGDRRSRAEGRGKRRSPSVLGRGRFYGQAPDIDGICLIRNGSTPAGRFLEARVVGTQGYDLVVEQI